MPNRKTSFIFMLVTAILLVWGSLCPFSTSGAVIDQTPGSVDMNLHQMNLEEFLKPQPEKQRLAPANAKLVDALNGVNAGDWDGAIVLIRDNLKGDPRSAPAHELLGAALALKGETDEGLKALEQAVQLDPRQATAWTKIGDVYLAKGEAGTAKEKFLKALEIDGADRLAHQRLGMIYEKEGQVKQAVSEYEKGLVGTPSEYVVSQSEPGQAL